MRLIFLFVFLFLSASSLAQTYALRGRVLDAATGEPLEDAAVQLSTGEGRITTREGRFSFLNRRPGVYALAVSLVGRVPEVVSVALHSDTTVVVLLQTRSFGLSEVVVTAREQRLGSSSVLDKSALIHTQPTSLADVLQLVPGQLAQNPNPTTAQQVLLRQVPATTDAARANAFGTAIVQDGVPVSNNANLQTDQAILNSGPGTLPPFSSVAGRGVDLRQISADNLESVEVIRGIPSARYGDLTSGLLIVRSRIGAFRPDLRVRLNPNLAMVAFGAGFRAPDSSTVAVFAELLRAQADPRNPLDQYTRLTGQVAWAKAWDRSKRFVTTTILAGYQTLDQLKRDPDDARYQRRRYADDKGLKFSTEGRWRGGGLNGRYLGAVTYSVQNAFYQELITRDLFPVTDALRDTTQVGRFGESEYLNQTRVSGKPLNVYATAELNQTLPNAFLGTTHALALGLEYRLDANFGEGRQFDPTRPPRQNYSVGDRPRSYRTIPPLAQLTYYAEDRVTGHVADRAFLLQLGLRFDNVAPLGPFRSRYGTVLAPRLNAALELRPDAWLRLGYGATAKAPPLSFLYPGKRYFDLVNFNYFAVNPAERLALLTTRVIDLDGQHLAPYRSEKAEVGLDIHRKNGLTLALTVFRETTTGAYGTNRLVQPYAVSKLVAANTPLGRPPVLDPVPARVDTFFAGYDVPVANRRYENQGLELAFDTPEWQALRTAFNLTGAFLQTLAYDDGIFTDADRAIFSTNTPERVPLYQSATKVRASRFNTSLRLIHRVPRLGLVLSALWQCIWLDRSQSEPLSAYAIGYVNRRGETVRLGPEQAQLPEYAGLKRAVNSLGGQPFRPPPLSLFNLRLTKEWARGYGFSFYANNVLASRPLYFDPRSNTYIRRNEALFFGAEVQVTL